MHGSVRCMGPMLIFFIGVAACLVTEYPNQASWLVCGYVFLLVIRSR